ncbi:hypothetical protein CWB89_14105 [Pseudoalteromonas piscicida]|uniref:Uncharacterized protein n=1 Tax=Pseudoalteromonas piscicida TaxID=43662 RepID=A0AAQ2IPY8_PSEO7|nr:MULTISPECIES: hypothetical protein [Pseudoalteromonas]KJY85615.1 hypothetical protein TW75_19735 [Pseudoalteromonas piscicida]TMN34882.1 hypothetical protein CWB94_21895 [Pseudoalteromonas piscicida]TMN39047.1 hypothetical protein CWB95_13280 [Pseudoalteromonas piscicida]TMN49534.1 hypothetical protein CWB91_16215 [Pseudoalteromonas piscicida]TMN50112.1 hypothetical protein CWB93_20985 [Pseudoalteromonas piscicida]
MALEQDIAKLIEASNDLTATVDNKIQDITAKLDAKRAEVDARLQAKEQAVDAKITSFQRALPLAPNALSDTKHFNNICADVPNGTAVDVIAAHAAPWSSFFYRGTEGTGTITKLSLAQLTEFGLTPNEEFLRRGLGAKDSHGDNYYGSDYRVLLLDVVVNKGRDDNPAEGNLFVLNQGCERYIGWGKGEFLTQASCWINVLEQTGTLRFYPSQNRSASISVDSSDAGKGWQYKSNRRTGWGGCHQQCFVGLGSMKVAIALPYVGTGDHGDNMIWADSVGYPYTHVGPTLSEGA